jgi:hypothetical protein
MVACFAEPELTVFASLPSRSSLHRMRAKAGVPHRVPCVITTRFSVENTWPTPTQRSIYATLSTAKVAPEKPASARSAVENSTSCGACRGGRRNVKGPRRTNPNRSTLSGRRPTNPVPTVEEFLGVGEIRKDNVTWSADLRFHGTRNAQTSSEDGLNNKRNVSCSELRAKQK